MRPKSSLEQRQIRLDSRFSKVGTKAVTFALVGTLGAGLYATTAQSSTEARAVERPAPATALPRLVHDPGYKKLVADRILARQIRAQKLVVARASVPPRVYSAALVQAKGNPIAANRLLIAHHVPPMSLTQATVAAKKLHYPLTKTTKKALPLQVQTWEKTTPTAAIAPVKEPQRLARALLSTIKPDQEAIIRERIVAKARTYLGVHEIMGPNAEGKIIGTNHGPVIDRFTGGQPNGQVGMAWCAAMASFVLNEAGMPLSGGKTLSKKFPDYRIVRSIFNPLSTDVMSLETAFQQQGYTFQPEQRLPEPGDIMLYTQVEGSRVKGGHTIIVERVLSDNSVMTIQGNINDAVVEKPESLDNPRLITIGSLFPE